MVFCNVKHAAVSAAPLVTVAGVTYALIDLHDICENVRDLNELRGFFGEQPACSFDKAGGAVEDISGWVDGVLDRFRRIRDGGSD